MNITDLKKLTIEELINLRNQCNYLINQTNQGSLDIQVTDTEIQFFDTLKRVASRYGVAYFPHIEVLSNQKPKICKEFHDKFVGLENWIQNNKFDPTSRQWLLNILCKILLRDLKSNENIDKLSYEIVLRNVHRIPDIFEKQFPDYIKYGLQGKLITRIAAGNES